MKSQFACFVLSFLIFSLPLTVAARDFVGYRHEGVRYGERLPNGAQDFGGGLLSDEDYGVTRFKKGDVYMLWFEKIISRNRAGVPRWEVRDVLTFEKLPKNQEFLFSYSSPCRLNKRENLDLIVLAKVSTRARSYIPLKAWIADVGTEKFKSVSVKAISCR
jgi:hypothetical protein